MKRGAGLRSAAFWCGAILLSGVLLPARAALFDDDEARRQVAIEKKRVDDLSSDLKAQQQAVDARIAKLEEALKGQALLDLFSQLESLKVEMNKLHGQIEVMNNNIENTAKRQRDMYMDLDTRLRRFEQQGIPAPAAAAPSGAPPAAAASSPAPSVAGAAAAKPAAVASSASVSATGTESSAETRTYEAAQGQRRNGNYQGAIVSFQNFIRQYPKSTLAPRAQYWVGDSYFNLHDFKLAIASQQALITSYPDSPTVPDAMLNIASSQIEMGESNAGKRTLEDLVAKFPISEAADKAKRRLAAFNAPAAAGKP